MPNASVMLSNWYSASSSTKAAPWKDRDWGKDAAHMARHRSAAAASLMEGPERSREAAKHSSCVQDAGLRWKQGVESGTDRVRR